MLQQGLWDIWKSTSWKNWKKAQRRADGNYRWRLCSDVRICTNAGKEIHGRRIFSGFKRFSWIFVCSDDGRYNGSKSSSAALHMSKLQKYSVGWWKLVWLWSRYAWKTLWKVWNKVQTRRIHHSFWNVSGDSGKDKGTGYWFEFCRRISEQST